MPKALRVVNIATPGQPSLAEEATRGLLATPAAVSPKFFYDALGSRLFDAITELDEYYPTRTEASIVDRHGADIARAVLEVTGSHPTLIDLGAGNCAKAASLFERLRPRRYVAVDISASFLEHSLRALQRDHPDIEMIGVGLDFSAKLRLPIDITEQGPVVFYPGSSIGNFEPGQALRLLGEARSIAGNGALLIGVDLVKPRTALEAAYDDPLRVTAAFNLNLLRHLNRVLDADFDVRDWRHVAFFNDEVSRIEMHLEARRGLVVRWPGQMREFSAGERIHTENSWKWTIEGFEQLLRQAGFSSVSAWTDDAGWFGVFLARA
jgi:L-histidine Nalpha-methyltransferase